MADRSLKADQLIPQPQVVRRRLDEVTREARHLRKLLLLAEHVKRDAEIRAELQQAEAQPA